MLRENATLELLGPNGEEYCSRCALNDRHEETRVDEILNAMLEDGNARAVAGVPIFYRDKRDPKYCKLITYGHRVSSLYKGWNNHRDNPHIRASIASGLQGAIEIHAETPPDVLTWIKKWANKFGGSLKTTLRETFNTIAKAVFVIVVVVAVFVAAVVVVVVVVVAAVWLLL